MFSSVNGSIIGTGSMAALLKMLISHSTVSQARPISSERGSHLKLSRMQILSHSGAFQLAPLL